MRRTLLKAKIQKAVVTEDHPDYEGSLGLDESATEVFVPRVVILDGHNRIKTIK
jgi:aspartate 1-decarboxylase